MKSNRRTKPSAIVMLMTALMVTGCATGPDYNGPPAVDLGSGWVHKERDAAGEVDLDLWWISLGDPALTRLIAEGVERNLDVRQALLRIVEARAALDIAESRRLPAVDAGGSVTASRQSENGTLPIGKIPGIDRDQTIHDLALDATWEIDLFGRLRRTAESASAQVEGAEEDARAVRISVAAEIAQTYFSLRGAQHERAARQASIAALQQSLGLARQRVQAGDLPPVELERIAAQLDTAFAALPGIEGRIRASALALGTLLGGLPEKVLGIEGNPTKPFTFPRIPVGERADLLRRRPDIRAAERRLAASTADIGTAMAEQFPKLTISASGGFQALALGDLLKAGSQTHAITPLISWRLFDGGRVKAEIRSAEARQQEAALAYEKSVLTALGEAERALSDYRYALDAMDRQRAAVDKTTRIYQTELSRFKAGDVSMLDVLESQRRLHEARETEARLSTSTANGMVASFKALGGGWNFQSKGSSAQR